MNVVLRLSIALLAYHLPANRIGTPIGCRQIRETVVIGQPGPRRAAIFGQFLELRLVECRYVLSQDVHKNAAGIQCIDLNCTVGGLRIWPGELREARPMYGAISCSVDGDLRVDMPPSVRCLAVAGIGDVP